MNNFPINLQVGDKVFVKTLFNWRVPLSYLSACVRFFAGMNYNHVRVVSKNDKGELVYVEALERGVVESTITHNLEKERVLIRRNNMISIADKIKYVERIKNIVGDKYDTFTLLVVELLWNTFGIWIGAKTEEEATKRFICYEVLGFLDQEQLAKEFPNLRWWMLHPVSMIYTNYTYTIYQDKL